MEYNACSKKYITKKQVRKEKIQKELLNGLFFVPLLLITVDELGVKSLIVCFCAAAIRSINNIVEILCIWNKAYEKYDEKTITKAKKFLAEFTNGIFIVPIFLICGNMWSWKWLAICILCALIRHIDDINKLFTKE